MHKKLRTAQKSAGLLSSEASFYTPFLFPVEQGKTSVCSVRGQIRPVYPPAHVKGDFVDA